MNEFDFEDIEISDEEEKLITAMEDIVDDLCNTELYEENLNKVGSNYFYLFRAYFEAGINVLDFVLTAAVDKHKIYYDAMKYIQDRLDVIKEDHKLLEIKGE
jgi:hypothetical protein